MIRKFILATLLLLVTFVFTITPAVAKPHTFGQQLAASQCEPGTHKMVLNIVFQVSNDADSGVAGYWAIDSYMKHVQAWDMGNNTFCVQVKYNGSFVTVDGVSPNGASTVDAGVTGTMEGGYNAILVGEFSPSSKRTKGNIGSKDNACGISLGVPSCSSTIYSWVDDYFTNVTSFTQPFWGWTYRAGENGTWVNSLTNSGDITGAP